MLALSGETAAYCRESDWMMILPGQTLIRRGRKRGGAVIQRHEDLPVLLPYLRRDMRAQRRFQRAVTLPTPELIR